MVKDSSRYQVIVVGAVSGWSLSRLEASAVARIEGPASLDLVNDIELSDLRLLRQRLAARHEVMMSQHRPSGPGEPTAGPSLP